MSGENLDYGADNGGEVNDWPDIRQRLYNANRHLRAMRYFTPEVEDDQEILGFHAQQAVENVLKGWISAIGASYRNSHNIQELAEIVLQDRNAADSPAGSELKDYLAYTSDSHDGDNWLSNYAVIYRYTGTTHRMDDQAVMEFFSRTRNVVSVLINHVHQITGTSPSDI